MLEVRIIKRKPQHELKDILIPIVLFAALIIFMYASLEAPKDSTESREIIREPAVAGTFYPKEMGALKRMIEEFYESVGNNSPQGNVYALIVPHAGYAYSGQTASFAYKNIENKKKVIILAPSHYFSFSGASIANATHYKTPLGEIRLSPQTKDIKEDLKRAGLLYTQKDVHEKEHSIESELPFLQESLENPEIIPVLIGGATNYSDLTSIADILNRYTDENTLIVASSDFTHYGPSYGYMPFRENIQQNIKTLDFGALAQIEKKDPMGLYIYTLQTGATICGKNALIILLEMIKNDNLQGSLLHYDTSGRISGNYRNSVSYVSYAFYGRETLSAEEQDYLAALARNTLESYTESRKTPDINEDTLPGKLTEKKGCFVTLTKSGNLRGCIGHILPQKPLYECVIENAVSAAVKDPRFSPVTHEELKDIRIEVSVLSVPEKLEFTSPDDLLQKLTPEKDGVIITYGIHRSTYLPQVWEQIKEKEEFLESLCEKGGAPADCWKKENVKIETYEAQVFGE